MPASFDRFIYYIVLNYLWLYCNKARPCLIPLEDHLWLILLIVPRGSDGDFLEKLISAASRVVFPVFSSPLPGRMSLCLSCSGGGSCNISMRRRWWWAEGCLLSSSTGGMLLSSIGHASFRRPGVATKGCVQSVFLMQMWDPQHDKPGCVIHGRLRALLSTFLSCCCKTSFCSLWIFWKIFTAWIKKKKKKSKCWADENN